MMTRREMLGNIGAAAIVTVASGTALASPTGEQTVQEFADNVAEIMRRRREIEPIRRIYFDRQVRLYLAGEPNDIQGTGDFTYEEYLAGFTPDCIAWINDGCPKGWRGPDKIRAERLALRRHRRWQKSHARKAVTQ